MYGKFKARAETFDMGFTDSGKEQVAVSFLLIGGDHDGDRLTWYGSFSDAAVERTLDSLTYAGWNGSDFVNLPGLGSTEVELDVAEEKYNGKVNTKVNWVNRIGVALKNQMDQGQKTAFANKMKGRIAAHQQKAGAAQKSQAGNGRRDAGGFNSPPPSDGDLY
jgi:hypothetical protein